jgi:tetratricopeptide (TPR) repeat protein
VCDVYRLSALTYLGRVADLGAIVPKAHRAVRERGDRYAVANFAFYESYLLLTQDKPDEAIAVAKQAIEPFPRSSFLAIHYGIAYAIAQGHLYRGEPQAAWDLVEREWPAWKSSGMASVQCVRTEIRYLRARVALALLEAGRKGGLTRKELRGVNAALEEDIVKLERDKVRSARPLALAVRAGLARASGNNDEALANLRDAESAFEENGMAMHAAASRLHIARLGKVDADRAEASARVEAFRAEGVHRPEAMFALAVPGFLL